MFIQDQVVLAPGREVAEIKEISTKIVRFMAF